MNQTKVYVEEFSVNEEGLLLVDDLELIEALRRRAKRQEDTQTHVASEARLSVKPS